EPISWSKMSLLLICSLGTSICCSHRWLICTLAVRFFQNSLNAELRIKSVGLFSVRGISIQFQPQHTLVGHWLSSSANSPKC
uniref:Uncharacterized protein n=1 Tax=Gadus morhua TaxID=8049 RepID=A0A8C5FVW2_GADMO